MRIALLSDIHGNDLALAAVLADIRQGGEPDAYWVLGDLAAIGPAPVQALELLARLPNARFVRGNTDRYVCTGVRPTPSQAEVRSNPGLVKKLVEIEGNFAWTQGALTATGWLDWLAALPLDFNEQLPDGTQVLCVHASPGTDDGPGIRLHAAAAENESLLAGCQADLVCVGHTHRPFSLQIAGLRVANPGSLSNPFGPNVRASYAILSAGADGYQVEHHRVDYDHAAVIAALLRLRHPAAEFIIRHLRGQVG
jgi:putative phosphoesterase